MFLVDQALAVQRQWERGVNRWLFPDSLPSVPLWLRWVPGEALAILGQSIRPRPEGWLRRCGAQGRGGVLRPVPGGSPGDPFRKWGGLVGAGTHTCALQAEGKLPWLLSGFFSVVAN